MNSVAASSRRWLAASSARLAVLASLVVTLAACTPSAPPPRPSQDDPPVQKPADEAGKPVKDDRVIVLFDGSSLKNWKKTEFGGEGEVTVEKGQLLFDMGAELTGVTWTGPALPRTNYEITWEAKKITGSDFFCGIGFPIGDSSASFVAGGWGGGVCGISSINGAPAIDNESQSVRGFDKDRWYRFRLRVTPEQVQVWLDEEKIVDVPTKDRKFSIHPAMQLSLPLGLTSYATAAAYRDVKLRKLDAK